MKLPAVLVVSLLVLAGCVTLEEPRFGRIDCRTLGEPAVATQFQLDRQVCLGRASASAARRGGTLEDVRHGLMLACMGERGYIYERVREHAARCGQDSTGRPIRAPGPAVPGAGSAAAPASRPAPAPAPAPGSPPSRMQRPAPAQAGQEARCRAIADDARRLRCFVELQQQRIER